MKVRLKYGLNVAGTFCPKGMELEVIDVSDERVQNVWPGIQARVGSTAVAVQFPHLNFPTFLHVNEIVFLSE